MTTLLHILPDATTPLWNKYSIITVHTPILYLGSCRMKSAPRYWTPFLLSFLHSLTALQFTSVSSPVCHLYSSCDVTHATQAGSNSNTAGMHLRGAWFSLGQDSGYPDWGLSCFATLATGKSQLHNDQLFPHSSQFIIHHTFNHMTLHSHKINHKWTEWIN